MHPSMHRNERGSFVYYTCDRLPVRHAFTTKFGGVSRGDCESLNLGFNRGDERENVLENYRILAEQLGMRLRGEGAALVALHAGHPDAEDGREHALREPVAPPQPSRPVLPPSRMTMSPGSGTSRMTFSIGAAPTTAPISMRFAT